MKEKIKLNKKKIIIGLIILTVIMSICIFAKYKLSNRYSGLITKAMSYKHVNEGDEATNCDFVKFDAFFLRDLDGDGDADGVRGTCKEIGSEDNLYFEIKIEKDGYFENGKITINATNSYLYTALVKDSGIKENYISPNTKEIELNQLPNGTQKLIITSIRSGDYSLISEKMNAINNNLNNYSGINSVTFTGTHVASDGTRTEIEKTVEFEVDWYGKLNCEIPETIKNISNNLDHEKSFASMINEESRIVNLDFEFITQETTNQALMSKAVIEGTIPELNGYKATKVEISGENVQYSYDEETGKFIAYRDASCSEDGNVTTQAYTEVWEDNRLNEYKFHIEYPLEAYENLESSLINMPMTIDAYYEGYNNKSEEFDNPFKSNVATNIVYFRLYKEGVGGYIGVRIGERITNPVKRYIVEKAKPLRIYNGISETESNDIYDVRWELKTDATGAQNVIIKETKDGEPQASDEFITIDGTHISAENAVKNVGIYIGNPIDTLGEDGVVKVYDDETDELIETFTKDNWLKYTKTNYYKFKTPVKHIRVETSSMKPETIIAIHCIKEIDDEYMVNNYTKEEFLNLKRIITYVAAYADGSFFDKTEYIAFYEAPVSIATLKLANKEFTTQSQSNNTTITIEAQTELAANQKKWINGTFLVKFPEEVLDIEINNININNSDVEIVSYEVFEENNSKFIRVITNNEKEATFDIEMDCNIVINPRVLTVSKNIELYATNENDTAYYYEAKDIYDVNQNGNKDEIVNFTNAEMIVIAPSVLLTNQMAMEYGVEGKVAIAPENALVSKDQRSVKINIELNNNYSNTVSDILVLGKIPFKGNKYVITNSDLGSTFNCTMKDTGIVIPEELIGIAKVYYSENESPTKELNNIDNGWTEEPTDFSKIKSYMIDLGEKVIEQGKAYNFYYELKIPEGLNYNDISYSHYGLYFSLDTPEGKYKTQSEPNKLGIMIAKEYELDIIKYQKGKDKKVDKAVYRIIEEGQTESKTRITDNGGKLTITGLVLGSTYKINEIKSPDQYELNPDEIVFTTHEENNDIEIDLISGTVKSAMVLREEGKDSRVQIEVEDEVRADFEILKVDSESNIPIKNVRYKITGKGFAETGKIVNTNVDGRIALSGLYINEEYTIEEIKADGYYISEPIKVKLVNSNGEYSIEVNGKVKNSYVTTIDDVPKINLEIEDNKIPTYNVEITKVKKGTEEPLEGAKFRLLKGEKIIGEYTTDENGKLTIQNLVINDNEKNIENIYTLKEVITPVGFTKIKDIVFKVEVENETFKYIQESENTVEAVIEGNTLKLKLEDSPAFKLVKKDGETANIIPGSKFTIYNMDNYTEEPARDSKGNIVGNLEIIDGKSYYVLITNELGEITASLPEGIYKAVEVQAPEKYELPSLLEDRTYYFAVGESREGELTYKSTSGYKLATNLTTDTEITEVVETSDGGTASVGRFDGDITLEDGTIITNAGNADTFIQKYDFNNNLQWFYNFGNTDNDELYQIISTSDNNLLVVGRFSKTITLSNGITLQSNSDSYAGIIIKYSEEGEILWYDVIDGSSRDQFFGVIEIENKNGETEYVTVGMLRSSSIELSNGEMTGRKVKEDIFIAIYSENGDLKNFKIIGGTTGNIGGRIRIDGTNEYGYVITAEFHGELTTFSNDIISKTHTSVPEIMSNVVMKINSNFEIEWENSNIAAEKDLTIGGIASTKDGGCISDVHSSGKVTLSNNDEFIPTAPNGDCCIIKYDSNGNIEWKKIYNTDAHSKVYDIKRANDGNVLLAIRLAGRVYSEGNFTDGSYAGYVVKYDQNGNRLLFQRLSAYGSSRLTSVFETDDGDILASGYFKNILHFYDGKYIENENTIKDNGIVVRLKKMSKATIEELYVDQYSGNGNEKLRKVISTNDGGYATVGFFERTITLNNGTTYTATIGDDGIFIKYNALGIVENSFAIYGNHSDYLFDIKKTINNEYLICGRTSSKELKLPNDEIKNFASSNDKGFIIKLNENFEFQWIEFLQENGDAELRHIKETQDGGFIVGGDFKTTITLKNGITLTPEGDKDFLLVKYNSSRNIEWARKIGGIGEDEVNGIEELNDGSIVVVGYASSSILEQGNELLSLNGKTGIVVRFDKDGNRKNIFKAGYEISSVCKTSDEGYLIAGYANDEHSIQDENGKNRVGMVTAKYNYNDNVIWINDIIGYGKWYSLLETKEKEYIFAGFTDNSTLHLSNGEQIVLTGYGCPVLGKIRNNGSLEWLVAPVAVAQYHARFEGVAELNDGGIVTTGYFESPTLSLENGQILNNTSTDANKCDGMVLKYVNKGIGAEDIQEITAYNYVKKFKITTEVLENNGVKGGNISGEGIQAYEIVKYDETSTKEIKITPNTDYKVNKILVNGEEIKFDISEDNTVTLPAFTNMKEDKHIQVSFIRTANEFILEKYSEDNKPLQGVQFKIEQIEGIEALKEPIEEETNIEGKISVELPIGTYKITEIKTVDGYQLLEEPITYEMIAEGPNVLKVTNKELRKVIVHHYLENTTTSVAEDEIILGKANEEYVTSPKLDLENYELLKDENDSYIIPDNASGFFDEENTIEVTYYYTTKKIPLKINHYIAGTIQRVTLDNGDVVPEERKFGTEGEEYTTSPIIENLHPKFELVEMPENANGIYQGKEIIVNYYYKIKEYKVITKVFGTGGSITSQNEEYHELVKYGENLTKEIIVTPEQGYRVSNITINGETYDFTEKLDRSVSIDNINNITEDKEVIVTFEKIQGAMNFTVEYYKNDVKVDEDTQRIFKQVNSSSVNSLYCWSLSELSYRRLDEMVNKLKINTLNVYVRIDDINSTEFEQLTDFCETYNIALYILLGDPSYYTVDNSLKIRQYADKIAEFNAKGKYPIKGIIGDIEFYTTDEYKNATKEEKVEIFRQYVETIEYNITYMKNLSLEYVVCMPVWFNSIDSSLFERLMSLDCNRYEMMNYSKTHMLSSLDEEIELAKKYNKEIISIGEFGSKASIPEDDTMLNDGIEYFLNIQEQMKEKYKYDKLHFGYHHYRDLKELVSALPNNEDTYKFEAYPYSLGTSIELTNVYAISGTEVIRGIPSYASSSGEYILSFYGMKYDTEYKIEIIGSNYNASKTISCSDRTKTTVYDSINLEKRYPGYTMCKIKINEEEVPNIPGIIDNGTVVKLYYYDIDLSETIDIELTKNWIDNDVQALRRPNTIKFIVASYEENLVATNETVETESITVETPEIAEVDNTTVETQETSETESTPVETQETSETESTPVETQETAEAESTPVETQETAETESKTVQTQEIAEAENTTVETQETTETESTTAETQEAENISANANEVTVKYYEFIKPVVKNTNSTKYTLYGIPKYDEITGKKIHYIVTEVEENEGDLKFYEPTGGLVTEETDEYGNIKYTAEIVNTFRLPEENSKDIKVTKVWKDNNNIGKTRPSSLILDLIGRVENVTAMEETPETEKYKEINRKEQSITATQNWEHTFTQNPIYDENGQEIIYLAEEKSPENNQNALDKYIGEVSPINEQNEIIITNTSIVQNSEITKTGPEEIRAIDSKVPYSIDYRVEIDKRYKENASIELVDTLEYELVAEKSELAGGTVGEDKKTVTWTGTYDATENKVIWDNDTQDKITTTITEDAEKAVKIITIHMEISVVYKDIQIACEKVINKVSGTITLANNVTDKKEVVCETPTRWVKDVVVNKLWIGDKEETRPDSIDIELKLIRQDENGNEVLEGMKGFNTTITPIVTENGITEWTYTYKDLPRYDADGNEYNYTVDETSINYTKGEQVVENKYYCEKTQEVVEGNTIITLINNKFGSIIVTKVDSRKEEVKLAGAEFKLERVIKDESSGEWIVPEEGSSDYVSYVGTTTEDGTYTFENLKYGFYKITETKAPEDYRISKNPIEIIEVNSSDENHLNVQVTVGNDKKYSLPLTGGIGMNIIKSAGILLVSIFAILLTNRKKIVPERRIKEEGEKPIRKAKDSKPVRRKK